MRLVGPAEIEQALAGVDREVRGATFEVTVTRTGPVTLTEHDAHEWAGPDEIPAVSDAVRELVTR
ncbi:hypothetical protein PUR61_09435 [Streptomyces sp. BE20]|uniref:hypothetical protein n=1 Tax=Streptomyces sp. BE20 TaxID=3002525 RepID=UPI002E7AA4CB|nr:hypothetical protein [Streptomyces sp. BE20]MEE1822414.1 hypothetical protein [Streptomyces sp. BE20]